LNEFSSASAEYDDPYAKLQENVRALDVVDAHRFSKGHGVRIAVIDTGVDIAHPDLAGRVEVGGNYVDTDVDALRSDRHGTQVAGLIAAAANNGIGIVGVAPEVQVLAFKACWHAAATDGGRCNSFTLAQALAGAITAQAHIINLSLIGPADPLLSALVKKAVEAKAIVVGAADPNAGPEAFPAALKEVIAVAESESHGTHGNALRAPGRDLVTLVPQGHYDFASGSSLAAAQVTGVIALLLERQRKLTTDGILRILRASTEERETAYGRVTSVNACRALAQLEPSRACAPHD
jgi:subtilisin family serine protease